MSLVLEQAFPLGRFHATRWNQNPFEDPYGEWPPSPWRLLRALAARCFQYSREVGGVDNDLARRLLTSLAQVVPAFRLPESSSRGVPINQYHPTEVTFRKKKSIPEFKSPGKTLVPDHYRAVPPHEPVLWIWERTSLSPSELDLLGQLLKRILYFGRAESYCRFRILPGEPVMPNCRLSPTAGPGHPVLAAAPDSGLNLESLLAVTDSPALKSRRIPPGTAWFYASIPPRPAVKPARQPRRRHPQDLRVLQFAVGGRVYPPAAHLVKLTERFRDAVVRQRCLQVSAQRTRRYAELTAPERDSLALIRGLAGDGGRVDGRATAFFALTPDDHGLPTRLVCWRDSPFSDDEIDALLAAAEQPLRWEYGSDDWQVRLVPLPFSVPRPAQYWGPGRVWESATPFVLPAGRRRTRRHGRQRPGETPEACLRKLLVRFGFPVPEVERLPAGPAWVTIHESPDERRRRSEERGTRMRPGHRFRVIFPTPVSGPLCVGHSCHFGLGLFRHVQ